MIMTVGVSHKQQAEETVRNTTIFLQTPEGTSQIEQILKIQWSQFTWMCSLWHSTEGKRELAARGFFMESVRASSSAEHTHACMYTHTQTHTPSLQKPRAQRAYGFWLNSILHEVLRIRIKCKVCLKFHEREFSPLLIG